MFDFYIACVRMFSISNDCYYWKPLKIYTSRSSCIRFFKSYHCKCFELDTFGILHISQKTFESDVISKRCDLW